MIKEIREISENIAAIASNFRKAQGQYNKTHNIGHQNTESKHVSTHNDNYMHEADRKQNVNQRNRYYTKHDRPFLGHGEHKQYLVPHKGNYRAFVPRNQHHGYHNQRPYSEPIPKYLNGPRSYNNNKC